jgi:hypothetical protein
MGLRPSSSYLPYPSWVVVNLAWACDIPSREGVLDLRVGRMRGVNYQCQDIDEKCGKCFNSQKEIMFIACSEDLAEQDRML